MLQPEILEKEQAITPFLRLAFRPFFLLPALLSVVSLVVWLLVLRGEFIWSAQLPADIWHGHEMIFGFAAAVAVGFLLTAAQTWTGVRSLHGSKLALAVVMWLMARIFLAMDGNNFVVLGILSQLFWWLIAVSYFTYMVIKANNKRNLVFALLLSLLMALDVATLLLAIFGAPSLAGHLLYAAVFLMANVVTILGGRVIPFFTSRALELPTITAKTIIEKPLIVLMMLSLICFLVSKFVVINQITGAVFILTGLLQLVRLSTWNTAKTLRTPLLWSLHLSYLNLAIGFIAMGISYFSTLISFSDAIHIITLGTIGSMILAMMARVSLGHTGRALKINYWLSLAFILLLLSAVARVLLPMLGLVIQGYSYAIVMWCIGFGIFIFYYTPILLAARPDGRSG